MSKDIPDNRLVRVSAENLSGPSQDAERLRVAEQMSDEESLRRAEADTDNPPLTVEELAKIGSYRARVFRVEAELLEWLDRQPHPTQLINDLLRRCKTEYDADDVMAVAEELVSLADRLRASAEQKAG